MKLVGIVLLILGIIGGVYFGIQAINASESFGILGAEVAVSTANWTPVIVSGVVLVIGVILMSTRKK